MRSRACLTVADVDLILAACRGEATKNHWPVSIAVVDDAGHALGLVRLDMAGAHTPEIALLKARTAAFMRTPTKTLEEMTRERPVLTHLPGLLPIQGGMPIRHGNDMLGAVGVSGVQSHEDEQVARAGTAAFAQIQP